ncbi:MAG: tetratricopeptide repeat protein [Brumimicrobium sp.]|nr:tetratricopeptide repeat protein [Brumimicrobium sp.]
MKRILLLFFVILSCSLFGQTKIDSLLTELKRWDKKVGIEADSNLYNIYFNLGKEYISIEPDTAIYYLQKSIFFAKNLKDALKEGESLNRQGWCYYIKSDNTKSLVYYQKSLSIAEKHQQSTQLKNRAKLLKSTNLGNMGILHYMQGNYTEALDYYHKALQLAEEIGNKRNQAANYGNIGLIYKTQGDFSGALEYYFRALKIYEEIQDKKGQSNNLANIGSIYFRQDDYMKAKEYYLKAQKINEETGNKDNQATNLGNIGLIYHNQQDYSNALIFYMKAQNLFIELGNRRDLATNFLNIGDVYNAQNDYSKALEYYFKALYINEEIESKRSIAFSLGRIGLVYLKQHKHVEANKYLSQAIHLGEELGIINDLKDLYLNQSELYRQTNNYEEALKFYKKHITLRDSLNRAENQKASIEKEMQYEFDKKEVLQQAEQDKKDAIASEISKKQVFQRNSVIVGFILMLGLAIVALRSYRNKRKDNQIISRQKEEVENQKDLVEEKNREIIDSITYARRIQSAILPPEELVRKHLPDSFILYKPKDIVAGDFYWMEQKGDILLFAAADCTGHGVPGAMVSVVCNHALNRSVREFNLTNPGEILDRTRELVIEEFEKSEEGVKDGMDISLCGINLKTNTLTWSGANNPLWIVRKDSPDVNELKANKQPIGKYVAPEPFDTHTIQLETGDSIYIFTDGYQDQFGGEKGKKFKAKNMRELILSLQNQPMDNQREAIDTAFEEWKQNHEQVDDVCVIGVRI